MLTVASVAGAYRDGIVDTGRETQFLFFVAFLVSFGFIRTSAHMIRAKVSWWPGNVDVGGTHIHHLVWGILLLLICGYIGVAIHPGDPYRDIIAVGFGIGTGLTLDEFALWLNLKDVYWSEQGRRSIDAVAIAAGLSGMLLVGYRSWIDAGKDVEDLVFVATGAIGFLGIALAIVNAAKEKFGMAIVSIPIPLAALPSAFRLAKPSSLWAKLFYRHDKKERSENRFTGPRGEPFWKRGGELLGRLRLRTSGVRGT
jgi:lysyl-tRNA synthetase, class II